MNFEILDKMFYGNTILSWGTALGIIVLSIVIAKIAYWIFTNFARNLTSKSKSHIDDIILDVIEEPISLAIGIFGIRIGVSFLSFPPSVELIKGKALDFLIILNIVWLIDRLINALFEKYLIPLSEKSENDLDNAVVPILQKGTSFILWSLGLVVGLNNAGYDVGAVLAGLGIGGLAFAIAAKDTVSNMFGGLTIFIDKPFKKTDRVKIKGIDGNIIDIGLRTTKLLTQEGRRVTIPNSFFIDNPVENITSEPSRKIIHNIKLAHTNNYSKVEESLQLIQKILDKQPNLDKEKTIVSLLSIEETGFLLQIIYYINYTSTKNIFDTQTQINLEILTAMEQNWIKLSYNAISKVQ